MTRTASPWDALLTCRAPIRIAESLALDEPPVREGTKLAGLLRCLANRGSATTLTLAVERDLTPRQVWGLFKQPRDIGRVTFAEGRWHLNPHFHGAAVERAAALLREHGWLVEPPEPSP